MNSDHTVFPLLDIVAKTGEKRLRAAARIQRNAPEGKRADWDFRGGEQPQPAGGQLAALKDLIRNSYASRLADVLDVKVG